MAADSNMSFRQGLFPSSFYTSHLVSFPQSGARNGGTGMIPVVTNSSSAISSTAGMLLSGNSSLIGNASAVILSGNSSGRGVDPLPGLKHDTGLAVEWSFEEQTILKEGLVKYASEPNIMKYIKIAALLRDKTVRDVALRCRWMTKKDNGKRRKSEESYMGKRMKDRKEKMADVPSQASRNLVQSGNLHSYPQLMHHSNPNWFSYEAPAIDGTTSNLFEENARVLSQISANLASLKIEDNIDLFCRTRSNIAAILTSMSQMPGIISRMPPLPVSVNEDLVNIVLQGTRQAQLFGTAGSLHSQQNP